MTASDGSGSAKKILGKSNVEKQTNLFSFQKMSSGEEWMLSENSG